MQVKFERTDIHDVPFAGIVHVLFETPAEITENNNRFKWYDTATPEGVQSLIVDLQKGTKAVTLVGKRDYNYFEAKGALLGAEYLEAYIALIEKVTGYRFIPADLFGLNLTAVYNENEQKIYPYHNYISYMRIADDCMIEADMVFQGSFGFDSAFASAMDYLAEKFGYRPATPEFVPVKGHYTRNLNYPNRSPVQPCASMKWLVKLLYKRWLDHHATPEQRQFVDAWKALESKWGTGIPFLGNAYPEMYVDGSEYVPDPNGTIDYDGKGLMTRNVSLDEFKALGRVHA